jgi:hypothetical protein
MKKIMITESQLKNLLNEGKKLNQKEIGVRLSKAKKLAVKFPNPRQFSLKYPNLWNFLRGQNLVDDVFVDRKKYNPDGFWTPEKVGEEAAKYKSSSEFQKNNQVAYRKATEFGILGVLFPIRLTKWNLDNATEVAKTFDTPTELYRNYARAYNILRDAGLLNDIYPNFVSKKGAKEGSSKYNNKTKEELTQIAKSVFEKNGSIKGNAGLYNACIDKDVDLDSIKKNTKSKQYRLMSDEELLGLAKKYTDIRILQRKDGILYKTLKERGLSKKAVSKFKGDINSEIPTDQFIKMKKDYSHMDDDRRNNDEFMFTPVTENIEESKNNPLEQMYSTDYVYFGFGDQGLYITMDFIFEDVDENEDDVEHTVEVVYDGGGSVELGADSEHDNECPEEFKHIAISEFKRIFHINENNTCDMRFAFSGTRHDDGEIKINTTLDWNY